MALSKAFICAALLLCAAALSEAASRQAAPAAAAKAAAGVVPPAGALPPGGPLPPAGDGSGPLPVCECALPPNGGGYFGRGQTLVAAGCKCKNACEIRPNGKSSCATLCDCPHGVQAQTFNGVRGPISATAYRTISAHIGRRLSGEEEVKMEYTYITP